MVVAACSHYYYLLSVVVGVAGVVAVVVVVIVLIVESSCVPVSACVLRGVDAADSQSTYLGIICNKAMFTVVLSSDHTSRQQVRQEVKMRTDTVSGCAPGGFVALSLVVCFVARVACFVLHGAVNSVYYLCAPHT